MSDIKSRLDLSAVVGRIARLLSFWSRRSSDPSVAMFRSIRLRLTLWYTGVLAAALLILGITLYLGVQHALLSPIDDGLHNDAQAVISTGPEIGFRCNSGGLATPTLGQGALFACYDQRGTYIPNRAAAVIPHMNDPALAARALQSGSATSTIDGEGFGRLRLYAQAIPDPAGGAPLGVVEFATQIGGQLDALHILLVLLLVLGAVSLLFAGVGGSFLANRALLPARRAHARQRDFIADASHELRTPLTLLRADAEVLLRGRSRLEPDDAAIVEDVLAEATHMTALANGMLNLARLDAGEIPIEQEVVDLAAVATEVARRGGPLAAEKGLTIHANDGAPVLVVGDRMLIEQAVLALLDNAIKYNHSGGKVTVHAGKEDSRALLVVRDGGIGIAAEHLLHLGERFYRVDKARSRELGGAGLGVSIARSIATRHGGSLTLSSEPGEGTTATLFLPSATS